MTILVFDHRKLGMAWCVWMVPMNLQKGPLYRKGNMAKTCST